MSEKKKKPLTPNDIMKYEITGELGLLDKVERTGWKSLTAKESGRIGGLMTKRKRSLREQGYEMNDMMTEEIKLE